MLIFRFFKRNNKRLIEIIKIRKNIIKIMKRVVIIYINDTLFFAFNKNSFLLDKLIDSKIESINNLIGIILKKY